MDQAQSALQYTAFVRTVGDGLGFEFPQVPRCFGTAENEDELLVRAKAALEDHLRLELKTSKPPSWPGTYEVPEVQARRLHVTVAPALALALQLKRMRLRKGWSQGDVAARAGITQQQVAKLEDPNSNPTFATVSKVAAVFDKPLMVLFK